MAKDAAQEALRSLPNLPREDGEPVFSEPWEARAFSMAVALNEAGVFSWNEWAEAFGANLHADAEAGGCRSYYEIWWQTLEEMTEHRGMTTAPERARRSAEWEAAAARTPHGKPIEL